MFKKICIFIAILAGAAVPAGPSITASALFEESTKEACRGVTEGKDATCQSGGPVNTLESRIGRIINVLSVIVGLIAVILIIINGLRFITANGDSNSISSARNGVIYAIVGLIIVALAQVIVRFVLSKA